MKNTNTALTGRIKNFFGAN